MPNSRTGLHAIFFLLPSGSHAADEVEHVSLWKRLSVRIFSQEGYYFSKSGAFELRLASSASMVKHFRLFLLETSVLGFRQVSRNSYKKKSIFPLPMSAFIG
jgi:hypothetical protein